MRKHLMMAMAAASAMAMLPMSEAAAQGNPYCNGKLQAASFYSTTQSTSTRSTVNYYLILQSTVGENVTFAVTFNDHRVQSRQNGTHFTRLGPWGTSQSILLGVASLNNPSGTGGPAVPMDLAAGTRVACR
ncbi:hypothetical protein [Sediminicoccus sp. KRV36]|uniref:hypothetical protein n=1 Tax=Sediminicoccus sp. KRV36 TaxID=3133721 RepID=UPI0020106574|nr:hypothetical protein [Sediminicoccus rosea]UPY36652.1 hypothetical protein LHU95_20890 [Sediminicoccus rosea]